MGEEDDRPLTRIERRWIATHRELLDAAIDELLGPHPTAVSASSIAQRADRAVGTFFNHFGSVEEAIDEALQPVSDLRDGAIDVLRASEDPTEVLPLILGTVVVEIVSATRELRATARARMAGYHLPGTGPLSEAVIEALGGARSENHLALTTELATAIIDHAVLVYEASDRPVTPADVEHVAWAVMTASMPPSADIEKIVHSGVEIALEQLKLS